jgi:excisionase family DNA binding protein
LDLQRAADELGVHYQTAYRWVRTGKLPAELVDGRYRVALADISEMTARRSTPKAPPPPSTSRLDRAAERMHSALVSGD